MNAELAEFTLKLPYHSNRAGPGRWIFSHALPKWPLFLLIFAGALGNALSLGLVQMWVGIAFNSVLSNPPNLARAVAGVTGTRIVP